MPASKMVPLVITDDLGAARAFYTERLDATIVYEMGDEYVQFRFGGEDGPELAFALPQPPDGPSGELVPFRGGVLMSIPVEDADAYRKEVVERGLDVEEPTDKPWGWRSFVVDDPAGMRLDFYHVIADDPAKDAAS